ncbi:zinc finger protein CONSTANS-LIKE 7 [Cornus florida]|uniref:zinc finger protein CONSTANS-LIKE 7 n=1 Tax=Cornus florida TaxID=4283 RepID=UPI00289B58D7|nr:zinc finger protein CONSTANS-LIKE 7 [Cornus florida]
MGHSSFLRSPKKEEQEVPDTNFTLLSDTNHVYADKKNDIMDELEGILGIEDEENLLPEGNMYGHLNWDFMDWEGFSVGEEEEEEEEGDQKVANVTGPFQEESHYYYSIKKENCGFWDEFDEQKRVSLNLSLNYQEVLDAWSGRGSLWADNYSLSMANNSYMGEVPVMEEERTRREASVLRYKEKRQSRLFSKKIRYQVRKLNADKRPRLKGRFVKRVPEKILK